MHRINYLEDIEGMRKLALWHARPWIYRLRYRFNVVCALVLRQITLKTCLNALEHSHRVVVVAMRTPPKRMLIVCPAAAKAHAQVRKAAPGQACDGDGHESR